MYTYENEFEGCPNGTNLEEIKCKEKACTIQTCPNYPEAQCMQVYMKYSFASYYVLFTNESMNNINLYNF